MPYFHLYAPDYPDQGAAERRATFRDQHLAIAKADSRVKLGGVLLSPNECLDKENAIGPDSKMIGSTIIYVTETYAEALSILENDLLWKNNVWDKERTTLQPWYTARVF